MACQRPFASEPTTHLYIFIDEYGDFNFSPKGSPYYIFSAVWTYDPTCLSSDLTNHRYELLHNGHDVQQFHANNDPNPLRHGVYAKLSLHGCIKGASIVLRKNRLYPALYSPEHFYPRFLDSLLKFVLKGDKRHSYSQVLLFTDTPPTKRVGRAVRNALKVSVPRYIATGAGMRIFQHAAMSHSGLQAADYCCWAIQRAWILNDLVWREYTRKFYDKSELDPFAVGEDEFY